MILKTKCAVIVFVYNRAEHTKKTISSILSARIADCNIYIIQDGINGSDKDWYEVNTYVSDISKLYKNIVYICRSVNYGLGENIIKGVSEVFDFGYDSLIVLEDDCVVSADYFDYMQSILAFYSKNNKVAHVSGFGLPIKKYTYLDNYFTPYPCSWGWATWKEEWEKCNFYDWDYYRFILSDKKEKINFDLSGKSFSYFLGKLVDGEINSWLIRWYVYLYKNKKLCSWAYDTKINNIGFDGSGVHKVKYDRMNQKGYKIIKNQYSFESDMNLNKKLIREFRQHFMGGKIVDKMKTVLYLFTGIIIDDCPDVNIY